MPARKNTPCGSALFYRMWLTSLKLATNIWFHLHSQNMCRNQGIEIKLVSLTVLLNNILVSKFLPLVPITLSSVNFNILERTSRHNYGFDKLNVPWPHWILSSFKPSIHPWVFVWVQAMKSPSGKVGRGRHVKSGYFFSHTLLVISRLKTTCLCFLSYM